MKYRLYTTSQKAWDGMFKAMSQAQKSIYLEMYDATLMLSDIIGVVTAERYDVIKRERKGQWKCQYETWHDRDETCRCGWGKSNKTPLKMPDVVNEFVSETVTPAEGL